MDDLARYERGERAYVHMLGLMTCRPRREGFALGVQVGVWLQRMAGRPGSLAGRVAAEFGVSRSQAYRWISAWRDESGQGNDDRRGAQVCAGLRFARAVSAGRACAQTSAAIAAHWAITPAAAECWLALYRKIRDEDHC